MIAVDGLQPGTGKSLLVEIIHLVAAGLPPSSEAIPTDEASMSKYLLSRLVFPAFAFNPEPFPG